MSVTLTQDQRESIFAIADVLLPSTNVMPAFRDADPTCEWGLRALHAHPTIYGVLVQVLHDAGLATDLEAYLRQLHDTRSNEFETLAMYVIGAYVMVPQVKELYGYPGQRAAPAPQDLAVEELSDEIFEGAMSYEGTYRDIGR